MKDIFKAFIVPYIIIYSFTVIGFMMATGQDVPEILWGIFITGLGKEGISFGIGKIRKKG